MVAALGPADQVLRYLHDPQTQDLWWPAFLRLTTSDAWVLAAPQHQNRLVVGLLVAVLETASLVDASRSFSGPRRSPLVRSSRDLETAAKLADPTRSSSRAVERHRDHDAEEERALIEAAVQTSCVVFVEGLGVAVLQVQCVSQLANVTPAGVVMLGLKRLLDHRSLEGHRDCLLLPPLVNLRRPSTGDAVDRVVDAALDHPGQQTETARATSSTATGVGLSSSPSP